MTAQPDTGVILVASLMAILLGWAGSPPVTAQEQPVQERPAAGEPLAPVSRGLATRLQAEIEAWTERGQHRGVSAAVILDDGREWVSAAGVEGRNRPLRPDHLIWIASITKSMTGAVVMQLAQEGALGLDDPVSRWLEPLDNIDPDVTIRQLLNHTNGLANYTASPELGPAIQADHGHRFTAEELIAMVGEPVFEPGARTQYTNTSFVLLGMIASEATGKTMVRLWQERLWGPLGLSEIFLPGFHEPPGPVAAAWAGRLSDREVAPLENLSLLSIGNAAFGLYSNARTVARWGRALFAGPVLHDHMRAEMLDIVPAAGNIPGESGAGLGIRTYGYLDREQCGGTVEDRPWGAACCSTTRPRGSPWRWS